MVILIIARLLVRAHHARSLQDDKDMHIYEYGTQINIYSYSQYHIQYRIDIHIHIDIFISYQYL